MASLYHHEAVLGMESQPNLDPILPPSGLCNAVILAKPYSSFIGTSQPPWSFSTPSYRESVVC